MDAYSSKREVEKPKTATEQRVWLVGRLRGAIGLINARRQAAALVFGDSSPVPAWLGEAQVALLEAVDALDGSRR